MCAKLEKPHASRLSACAMEMRGEARKAQGIENMQLICSYQVAGADFWF
jgi:hypothetical protein